jgi:hypothetical protein
MSRRLCVVVAALVAVSTAIPSAAQPPGGGDANRPAVNPDLREAARHFERGVKLYDEQDWRAALIEFERAYATAPHFAVLYNIGQCRYQLLDYAGALTAFERYLALGGAQGPADVVARVKATVEDLKARVARVVVAASVDDAEITVDDVVVGKTPLASPLVVSEGRRKIAASKDGYATATRLVDLAGNDATEVTLRLERLETAWAATRASAVAPTAPVERASRGGRSAAATFTMFGLAAAGIVTGTAFGLVALEEKNDLNAQCPHAGCAPGTQSRIDTLHRNAVVSTIGFSVGVSGLACGLGYLMLSPGRPEAGKVRPFVGPGVAGATGSFW